MKKLNIKGNGNFSVVSHKYVLYGRKNKNNKTYVHFELPDGTTYMVDDIDWKHVINLVREKISWRDFFSIVEYWWNIREEEEYFDAL